MIATAVQGAKYNPKCAQSPMSEYKACRIITNTQAMPTRKCVKGLPNHVQCAMLSRKSKAEAPMRLRPRFANATKGHMKGLTFKAVRACSSKRHSHHHTRSAIYPGQLCSDWDRN